MSMRSGGTGTQRERAWSGECVTAHLQHPEASSTWTGSSAQAHRMRRRRRIARPHAKPASTNASRTERTCSTCSHTGLFEWQEDCRGFVRSRRRHAFSRPRTRPRRDGLTDGPGADVGAPSFFARVNGHRRGHASIASGEHAWPRPALANALGSRVRAEAGVTIVKGGGPWRPQAPAYNRDTAAAQEG